MLLPKQVCKQRILIQELIEKIPLLGSSNGDACLYKVYIFAQWWKRTFGSKLDVYHAEDVWKPRSQAAPPRALGGAVAAEPVSLHRQHSVKKFDLEELEESLKKMANIEARLARFEAHEALQEEVPQ
jgi:hypothetical protein